MNVKDEVESMGGMTKEHNYLGSDKQSLAKGHVPLGKIPRRTKGTSNPLAEPGGGGKEEQY
jgi:hypothetical protein